MAEEYGPHVQSSKSLQTEEPGHQGKPDNPPQTMQAEGRGQAFLNMVCTAGVCTYISILIQYLEDKKGITI